MFDLGETPRPGRRLGSPKGRAVFVDALGRYVHVTPTPPDSADENELTELECVVGERWVVTAHERASGARRVHRARHGKRPTGDLDGPAFLARLLEWVLRRRAQPFERVEQELEEFDTRAMRGDSRPEKIEYLVGLRVRVGRLRRASSPTARPCSRSPIPELEALGDDASGDSSSASTASRSPFRQPATYARAS